MINYDGKTNPKEKIKYKMYEVIESDKSGYRFRIIGLMREKDFNEKYGDRKILSIKNYNDTKTTSIIIERR